MNFKKNESRDKLRGGYYTPLDLAAFLARWIGDIHPRKILEPSCGDGVFFEALASSSQLCAAEVTALELDKGEAKKAHQRAKQLGLKGVDVKTEDFLEWALLNLEEGVKFDAVLGNPPFVRYQYLPEPFQARSERIFEKFGLKFTKHTNAWVPFIVASMALLRPGGRLAMVVPAEIIHVTHAQSLRSYLGTECRRIVIVDPEELWFDNTLQGAVLLLAEKLHDKAERSEGLGIYPVRNREFLRLNPNVVLAAPNSINGKTVQGKWTRALLDPDTRNLLDDLTEQSEVYRFDDVAEVDVGIVTGANKYFLVTDEIVRRHKLSKWAHPMFGRSEHCPGVIYDEKQHALNARKGNPTNFLWFQGGAITASARGYINLGEDQDLHTRFKCRVRSPWYTVPSVYATEVGMLKRAHDVPRLILNKLRAYTTDTAYRIRSNRIAAERLVGCFINPLTAASAELEGRHYGGGVLELIPSEIERLLLPLPRRAKVNLRKLDADVRSLPAEVVLIKQGRELLGAVGVSRPDQDKVFKAWEKLRDRRQRTSSDTT